MNMIFKLATICALLGCAAVAVADAGTAAPMASVKYPPGPVRINPQPLPPLPPHPPNTPVDRALSSPSEPTPFRINPQPLPPIDSRPS